MHACTIKWHGKCLPDEVLNEGITSMKRPAHPTKYYEVLLFPYMVNREKGPWPAAMDGRTAASGGLASSQRRMEEPPRPEA